MPDYTVKTGFLLNARRHIKRNVKGRHLAPFHLDNIGEEEPSLKVGSAGTKIRLTAYNRLLAIFDDTIHPNGKTEVEWGSLVSTLPTAVLDFNFGKRFFYEDSKALIGTNPLNHKLCARLYIPPQQKSVLIRTETVVKEFPSGPMVYLEYQKNGLSVVKTNDYNLDYVVSSSGEEPIKGRI